jgi:uncharacterized phage-associated protein
MKAFVYNEEKLQELMLYVAGRCEAHARFGATKLNKILFYADFFSYGARRKPITGAEYQRFQFGPAPVRLLPVEAALINSGAAVKRPGLTPGNYTEKRLIALRMARLDLFDAEEISIVESVIEAFKDASATDVSNLSHALPAWKFAKDREIIPYCTALLPQDVGCLSSKDKEWADVAVARFAAAWPPLSA